VCGVHTRGPPSSLASRRLALLRERWQDKGIKPLQMIQPFRRETMVKYTLSPYADGILYRVLAAWARKYNSRHRDRGLDRVTMLVDDYMPGAYGGSS
jgi:hypothetical protein